MKIHTFLPKMTKIVCRICLRSDIERKREVDESLTEFYDELMYFDTQEHAALTVCPCCEHRLRKFYNFRQQCRRAHILLKTWSTDQTKSEKPLEDLYKMVPKPSLGVCTARAKQKVLGFVWAKHEHEVTAQHSVDYQWSKIKHEVSSQHSDQPKVSGRSVIIKPISDRSMFDKENNNKINTTDDKDKNLISSESLTSLLQGFLKHNMKPNVKEAQMELQTEHFSHVDYAESFAANDKLILKGIDNFGKKIRTRKPVTAARKANLLEKIIKKRQSYQLLSLQERSTLRLTARYTRKKQLLKEKVLKLLERGELQDISDLGVSLDKEVFLKIFERCARGTMLRSGLLKERISLQKLREFLLFLLRMYNPAYETIFSVEYLDSHEKRVAEFNSRQHSKEFLEAQHRCEICYKVFEFKAYSEWHKNRHNPKHPAVCEICSMRYTKRGKMLHHFAQNHQFVYSCKQCPLRTRNTNVMRSHFEMHKGAVQCPYCNETFKTKSMLEVHSRHAHTHVCAFCAKHFMSLKRLQYHVDKMHADVPPEALKSTPRAQCASCAAAFHSADALRRHVAWFHRTDRTYECPFCNEMFESLAALRTHKVLMKHRGTKARATVGEQPYRTCPLCHEAVPNTSKGALWRHYKAAHPAVPYDGHLGARDFLCEQCGRGFKFLHLYLDHMNSHTGAKPYGCGKCDARFTSRILANSHAKKHNPTRNKSPIKFRNQKALADHIHTKSEERRPYECDTCGKTYVHRASFRYHTDNIHKQNQLGREKLRQRQLVIQDDIKNDHVHDDDFVNQEHVQDDELVNQEYVQDDELVNQDHVQGDELVNQEHVLDDEFVNQEHVQDDEFVNQEYVQDDELVNQDNVQGDELVNQKHVQGDELVKQDHVQDDEFVNQEHVQDDKFVTQEHVQGDELVNEDHVQGDELVNQEHVQDYEFVNQEHVQYDDFVNQDHVKDDEFVKQGGDIYIQYHVQNDEILIQDQSKDEFMFGEQDVDNLIGQYVVSEEIIGGE